MHIHTLYRICVNRSCIDLLCLGTDNSTRNRCGLHQVLSLDLIVIANLSLSIRALLHHVSSAHQPTDHNQCDHHKSDDDLLLFTFCFHFHKHTFLKFSVLGKS